MIYISTVSRRGLSHPDWNEDNFHYKQTSYAIIGGVFDGCSSGKDSYFASKLFANMFKRTIEEVSEENLNIKNFPSLVNIFFKNLNKAIKAIGLQTDETLSTAVLFIYEVGSNNLLVKFFGDGVAYASNQNLEIFNNDEDNKPDYVGYSLDEILKGHNFNKYWEMKRSFIANTKDFSISTDGIFSFVKTNEHEPDLLVEPYLVQDNFLDKNPASLKRKLNIIRNKGYDHHDDITIIRVKIDE
jgi:serine/threonine protein phosphatase PrpC